MKSILKKARVTINRVVYNSFKENNLDDDLRYIISELLFKVYKTGFNDALKLNKKVIDEFEERLKKENGTYD